MVAENVKQYQELDFLVVYGQSAHAAVPSEGDHPLYAILDIAGQLEGSDTSLESYVIGTATNQIPGAGVMVVEGIDSRTEFFGQLNLGEHYQSPEYNPDNYDMEIFDHEILTDVQNSKFGKSDNIMVDVTLMANRALKEECY